MTLQRTEHAEIVCRFEDAPADVSRAVYASGECEIDLARHELRVLGHVVPVGGRAFEIIAILAQSAGELVSKDELMVRIWPGAIVMDSTLYVHAASVRKALGPHRNLLRTVSGRGYRLLGNWTVRRREVAKPPIGAQPTRMNGDAPANNFPAAVTHLVGRSAAVQRLHDLASAYRIVTLTGPGGIGKTVLALQVARGLARGFADGGWFVELAGLSDPHLVPSAVATALGLSLGADTNALEAVARAIGGKELLLILDNCEHVIDTAAPLAELCARLCPRVTVLATSREVFRIEGEYAFRVPPLHVPAQQHTTPDEILSHSAAKLFVARTTELGLDVSARAEALRTIASICRRLDGIPLAIEFAAARAATLGIDLVAAGLQDRFELLTTVRRTALPRHRTLRATLDWSYQLLTEAERRLLRRLAIFSGGFSLAAASAVVAQGPASEAETAEGVANLAAKSLVASDLSAAGGHFRLLETTRVYATSKLSDGGELQTYSRRHAAYYRALLSGIAREADKRSVPAADVDNVRAALEWCFGPCGDPALGVGLAAVAAPVFLAMSLLPECLGWSERAIQALDDASRGGAEEMNLQASLGVSSMHLHGQSDAARGALARSLAIAEARGDVLNQVGLLGMLSMFDVRDGDFTTSLHDARLSRAVEGTAGNTVALALANSILGRALQFVGDHDGSRRELAASFHYWCRSPRTSEVYLGLDHHILVGIGLARNLWLQGHPAQAVERVRQTIRDAEQKNHPASLGLALSWAPGVFLWTGDLDSATDLADRLRLHAEAHSLRPYLAVARGYRGAVAVGRGEARAGVEDLQGCLDQLHAMRYRMLSTGFRLSLVEGLVATGLPGKARALAEETIRLVRANGDLVHMPEALRMRGRVLLSMPRRRADEAELCFLQSLEWSRRQGARAWELRAATELAALWVDQGQADQRQADRGRALLAPVFDAFMEGLDTADLRAAACVLAQLR